MTPRESICPGCGLCMPAGELPYDRYFHASPECWSVYTEVLQREFQDALLFGQVHSLTVDAYAAQHAGGPHPDKSVCAHLVGLHLALERGFTNADVPPRLRRLVEATADWPHLDPPAGRGALTVFDVAGAASSGEHADRVRAWAAEVWGAWRAHHTAVRELARACHAGHRSTHHVNRSRA